MRASRRRAAVLLAAGALLAPLALPTGHLSAAAADDQDALRRLQAAASSAAGDADARDAAAEAAARRLSAADVAVAQAEAALRSASGRLSTAQALLSRQHRALAVARGREAAARRAVDAARGRVSTARSALRGMLRTGFESGLNSELDSLAGVTNPGDLADRVGLLNHLSGVRHRRLEALGAAEREFVAEQRRMSALSAQAAQLVQAAGTQVAVVDAAVRQGRAATAQLQQGRAERATALVQARRAAASAQYRYRTLASESDHLAAVLRARAAAQAAARAAARAAAAAAARAAAVRAAAAAAAQAAADRAAAARAAGSAAAVPPPAVPATPAIPDVPAAPPPAQQAAPVGGGFVMPAEGTFSSGFGPRVDPLTGASGFHPGQDIAAPEGTPIVAATSGEVAYAGWEQGYGNFTCIDRGDGLATCYGHQSAILVTVGQQVQAGQLIGRVGTTGWSTGPHLHFEVRLDGTPVDPMPYF